MNPETAAIIERKRSERRAAGLMVIVTFEGREPFEYCARDVAAHDRFIAQMTAKIDQPDSTGSSHIVRSVEIAEH